MEPSSGKAHRSLSASVWVENSSAWSRPTIATGTFILPPSPWRDSIVISSSCNRCRTTGSDGYGNDGDVRREEKQKPFPLVSHRLGKLAKTASFPHSHSFGDDLGFP